MSADMTAANPVSKNVRGCAAVTAAMTPNGVIGLPPSLFYK